jgi:phosphohistidine phosphatase
MSGSRLILIRHAKSDYPWGVDDHDRPLNERGRRDAPGIGDWLEEHVSWERPPVMVVSTARRAQATWDLARTRLSDRWRDVDVMDEPRIYEAPMSELCDVVAEAAQRTDTVVLVGHNPGVAAVTHHLAVPDDLRDEATAKFPTSAVADLVSDADLVTAVRRQGAFRMAAFFVARG